MGQEGKDQQDPKEAALHYQSKDMERLDEIDDLEDLTKKGVKDNAKKFGIKNKILDFSEGEGKPFKTCKYKPEDLSQYGIGLVMYLDFVKWLSLCFLVLSSLTISALWLNNHGDSYPKEDAGTFERFTIGNLDTGKKYQHFWVDDPDYAKLAAGNKDKYYWKELKRTYLTPENVTKQIIDHDKIQQKYENDILDDTDKRNKQIAAIDFCVSMTFLAFMI